jgi:dynein heavy chain 2, cytosolic
MMDCACVLCAGADPSQELGDYACSKMGRGRYHEVAMGQGQAPLALQLLRDCAKNGAACFHRALY